MRRVRHRRAHDGERLDLRQRQLGKLNLRWAGDGYGEFRMQPLEPASDGAYYVSSEEGVLRSTDGVSWSLVWQTKAGQLPSGMGIALSSTTIYSSDYNNFYSAPISDYTNWSTFPGPAGNANTGRAAADAEWLAYDQTHHILYAACQQGGLYRFVTQ